MTDNTKPRPFDLSAPSEVERLISETYGYMLVSLRHGTDREGREYALAGLREYLNKLKGERA